MRVEHQYYYYPPQLSRLIDLPERAGKFILYCYPLISPPPFVQVPMLGKADEPAAPPTLSETLDDILNNHPQVIAFGEIHPISTDPRTTLSLFMEEILPKLAEAGITDLICEMIFDSPEIEAELNSFYENGELSASATPNLHVNLCRYFDRQTFFAFLRKARELGIRLHPGGVSPETASETLDQLDYDERPDLQARAIAEITRHIRDRAEDLVRRDRRIAIYSGLSHNDIHPSRQQVTLNANFGRALAERLGDDYIAVDLVLPYGLEGAAGEINVEDPQQQVPASGINVIKDGNSYTIFFPQ